MMSVEERVERWVRFVLGDNCMATHARALRFLEEAHELAQVCGVTRDEASRTRDMVYSKPAGSAAQEIGGCGVTLAGVAASLGVSVASLTNEEMRRIEHLPPDKFRARERLNAYLGIGIVPSSGPLVDPASSEGKAQSPKRYL